MPFYVALFMQPFPYCTDWKTTKKEKVLGQQDLKGLEGFLLRLLRDQKKIEKFFWMRTCVRPNIIMECNEGLISSG